MFSLFEFIFLIAIIIVQCVIAAMVYRQISQINSFLPEGRESLSLKEYEIPADKILELEPSDVVDRITYLQHEQQIVIDSTSDDYDNSLQEELPF